VLAANSASNFGDRPQDPESKIGIVSQIWRSKSAMQRTGFAGR